MKIGILGGGEYTGLTNLTIAMHALGHEVIVIRKDETSLFCASPLPAIGVNLYPEYAHLPEKDNSFRGGAIGKGGKIKYQRK